MDVDKQTRANLNLLCIIWLAVLTVVHGIDQRETLRVLILHTEAIVKSKADQVITVFCWSKKYLIRGTLGIMFISTTLKRVNS